MFDHSTYPKRKKRAESFLGIHFDFHAGHDCTEVGKSVTREMIEGIIDKVRPDYLQCDCKGHPGISSYPTKVGNPAPGFVKDQLRIWREVTAERGVGLFMHYSGVYDIEAVTKHPSWARIDEKGKRDKQKTSVFGPYVDKLMIPQLKELCDEYGVDGVWVDGESWATEPDYGKRAREAWKALTGSDELPKSPEDPQYWEFREFCREGFRRYVRHYVDEMHRHNPGFQIASNWAFTSDMPEPVSADIDFISGDYPLQDSVNVARMVARCIARQGKPWDLMAWAFSGRFQSENIWSTKTPVQLCQEASVVLAMGGGFQAYFTQKHDGAISEWQMDLMAETAKFCRAREELCHRAEVVPQIGLVLSTAGYYHHKAGSLFAPWGGELVPISGVLNALLDAQQSVEILMEHQLQGRLAEYPLIVIPEWDYLAPEFVQELKDYVCDGGNLLLVGPGPVKLFADELDITLQGEPTEKKAWVEQDGWLAGILANYQATELGPKAQQFGKLHAINDRASASEPAAVMTPYGKGKVAGVLVDLGRRYRTSRTSVVRNFLSAIARELCPEPLVEVTGSHFVDVVPTRQDGKLMVNLINTAGPHHDPSVYTYDEIPPLGPLSVTIRTAKQPKSVTIQPADEKLAFSFQDGKIKLTVQRIAIHEVIVVE